MTEEEIKAYGALAYWYQVLELEQGGLERLDIYSETYRAKDRALSAFPGRLRFPPTFDAQGKEY